MYGAILGDIIGSPYEFDFGKKTKDFPLFGKISRYTDDSLMSIAVCDGFMTSKGKSDAEIKKSLISSIKKWASDPKYNHIMPEYGARFSVWLEQSNPKPYNSKGNGSAMRVASAGWLYDSLDEVRRHAKLSAEISHNHPEGIKGAEAVAEVIFLARMGKSKEYIRQYVTDQFKYNLDRTVDQIRPGYSHKEICEECIPQAIICFLDSNSYEDCIKNAVSIGGDTDTIGCIAGSMAEAFFGVPAKLKTTAREYISPDMLKVLNRFNKEKLRYTFPDDKTFNPERKNPLDMIKRMNEVGDIYYEDFIHKMNEASSDDSFAFNEGRDYYDIASRASIVGYPLNDIETLMNVKNILNMRPDNISPEAEQLRKTCLKVLDNIVSNRKDGNMTALNAATRIQNFTYLRDYLNGYAEALNDDKSQISMLITEVASAGLDERISSGLEPDEKIRFANKASDLMDIFDTVDPSMMRSSSSFRDLKSAIKTLIEREKQLDESSYTKDLYEQALMRIQACAEDYLQYKKAQNTGSHKRSAIELKRVKLVNALLYKVENQRNTFLRERTSPVNEKYHELIAAAKKTLALEKDKGVDDSEKLKAASVLYAAEIMKVKMLDPTGPNLVAQAGKLQKDAGFKATVNQIDKKDIEDSINNGYFTRNYNIRANYNQWIKDVYKPTMRERKRIKAEKAAQKKRQEELAKKNAPKKGASAKNTNIIQANNASAKNTNIVQANNAPAKNTGSNVKPPVTGTNANKAKKTIEKGIKKK